MFSVFVVVLLLFLGEGKSHFRNNQKLRGRKVWEFSGIVVNLDGKIEQG